jgi:phage prohead protease, HK97 family
VATRIKETDTELDVKFVPATADELKAIGDDLPDGYIAGWASTPDIDRIDDIVATGAFDESISIRGLDGPKAIKLLLDHRSDKPAGSIKVLETRNGRLWMEAELDLEISYVRDRWRAAKSAGGFNFSVGFRRGEWEWKEVDGDEIRIIRKADLWEVSVVTFPMNEECTMTFVKSDAAIESLADFEKFLVSKGFARSRNHAREITQVVKNSVHVFENKPPRLADSDVKSVVEKLAALKSQMAQVAAKS